MRKFTVYFEPTADGFVLYDYADRPTTDSFLSLHNIAAIIPEGVSEERERDRMICFLVHLKDRPPIKVYAHSFDSEPTVSFRYHHQDGYGAPISKSQFEERRLL